MNDKSITKISSLSLQDRQGKGLTQSGAEDSGYLRTVTENCKMPFIV